VRRELIRIKATAKLVRLEDLLITAKPFPVTSRAWLKAAEFWAIVRSAGKPTADPHALDGDAILAGVAATIGIPSDRVTIATTNVGHLARFPGIDAQRWEAIS
jgi:predicted nucleic acid-binding protein